MRSAAVVNEIPTESFETYLNRQVFHFPSRSHFTFLHGITLHHTSLLNPFKISFTPKVAAGRQDIDGSCPVCMEEYAQKDLVRSLPWCSHFFHADCCQTWLLVSDAIILYMLELHCGKYSCESFKCTAVCEKCSK
jgi:hypothetical protein